MKLVKGLPQVVAAASLLIFSDLALGGARNEPPSRAVSPPLTVQPFVMPPVIARSPEFRRDRIAVPPKTRGNRSALYRKVGPATVIVRTRNGYGSGIVISADGYILTNHHVAADGQEEDFTIKLGIERGKIGPDGVMQQIPGTLWARVVRWDEASDVALLKLDDPPRDLAFAPLAPKGPVPGEEAFAVGHGGIGLLWSFRACNVTGVGERRDIAAKVIVSLHAKKEGDPAGEPPVRVVQSSCVITPGDSGGPLFNQEGQVVALNSYFSHSGPEQFPQTASFHVDWKHLKPIVAGVGAKPMRVGPDPWEGVAGGLFGDLDGDGAVDSLRLFAGTRNLPATLFFDVRQRTVAAGDPDEIVEARRFPFDLAVMDRGSRVFALTAGRLLEVDREGRVLAAFERSDAGDLKPLPVKSRPASVLESVPSLSEPERTRLTKALAMTYPGLLGAGKGDSFPDPRQPFVGRLGAKDADGDGVVDSISYASVLGLTLMLDPYNHAFRDIAEDADVADVITRGKSRPRIAVVFAPPRVVLYFSRPAGQPWDRVMECEGESSVTTLRAWIRSGETWRRDTGLEGRQFVADPAWLASAESEIPAAEEALVRIIGGESVKINLAARVPDVTSWEDAEFITFDRYPGGELVYRLIGGEAAALVVSTSPGAVNVDEDAVAGMLSAKTTVPLFQWVEKDDGTLWVVYDFDADGKPNVAQFSAGERFVELRAEKGGALVEIQPQPARAYPWQQYAAAPHREAVRQALEELTGEEYAGR